MLFRLDKKSILVQKTARGKGKNAWPMARLVGLQVSVDDDSSFNPLMLKSSCRNCRLDLKYF